MNGKAIADRHSLLAIEGQLRHLQPHVPGSHNCLVREILTMLNANS